MGKVAVKTYSYVCTKEGILPEPRIERFELDPSVRISNFSPGGDLVLVLGTLTGYECQGGKPNSVPIGESITFALSEYGVPEREKYIDRLETLSLDGKKVESIAYPRSTVLEVDGKEYGYAEAVANIAEIKTAIDRIRTEEALDAIGG